MYDLAWANFCIALKSMVILLKVVLKNALFTAGNLKRSNVIWIGITHNNTLTECYIDCQHFISF